MKRSLFLINPNCFSLLTLINPQLIESHCIPMFRHVIISAIVSDYWNERAAAMKLFATLALSLCCYLLTTTYAFSAPGKIYKWTDNKGQVHYSERPPLGTQTEVVKPQIGHSEPVNYETAATEKAPEAKKAASAKNALKDPERCDAARKNLDLLKTYTRIKIQGDDGEYRFLTPDEQKQKADEAAKAIEESCD
jgi:hypothetical protein